MEKKGEIIIYQTPDGQTEIDVTMEKETVWLSQHQIAKLFDTDRSVITKHINNIYKNEELEKDSTCAKIAQVQIEGDRTIKRQIAFYNLDVIISIGYRVNSKRGTHFRQWANKVLKDYLIKGYAINQRMKEEQLADLKNTVKLLSNVIACSVMRRTSLSTAPSTPSTRLLADRSCIRASKRKLPCCFISL